MKIMGLKEWVHRFSWFLTSFVLFLWIALSTTWVASGFLPKTNKLILFAYFWFFGLSEIFLCFLISVFFSNSKLAAIMGPVVLDSLLLPKYIFANTSSNQSLTGKIFASLLSPTCFSLGADILAAAEYANVGVQFSTLNTAGYNMSICLGMLIFDTFLYAFLAYYLDNVLQHEVGISKHPLFFLQPSYWCGDKAAHNDFQCRKLISCCFAGSSASATNREKQHGLELTVPSSPSGCRVNPSSSELPDEYLNDNFEPIPDHLRNSIKMTIQNLHKVYPDGKKAVRGISLDILECQITCLLGHNGAGKSTTMSMLTGMTAITSGDCIIYGHRLSVEMKTIRTLTGMCPQHNIIFPNLTVREHLYYFGALKGRDCG
jgi:ATP-binding cassette subfamily A (ABC1) protein 3